MSERTLSLKFRALAEPFLGIGDQFSSPAFHVPCRFYFWSLALRMSWIEGEETDNKVISPSSSITLQRVWMSEENWVSSWNNLGDWLRVHFTYLVAQTVKRLPAMQETQLRFLGWEDPLEKEMAPYSSTLAWKIPWTEEPDRLQSMGSQRVGHNWATSLFFHFMVLQLPEWCCVCPAHPPVPAWLWASSQRAAPSIRAGLGLQLR